jgi:hypothetical protein
MHNLMLIKVFTISVIVLYFIFVTTDITVICYLWLEQDIARSLSSYTVGILHGSGWHSRKEFNLKIISQQ